MIGRSYGRHLIEDGINPLRLLATGTTAPKRRLG